MHLPAKFILLLAAVCGLESCAQLPPPPSENAITAQCPVCRHRRDWSCLTVEKKPTAPHLTAGGKEYWFCSEDCKCDFAANPAKFEL